MSNKLLILKTNKEKLHDEEFVKPVINIVKEFIQEIEIRSIFDDPFSLTKYSNMIITGTSLQDMAYKEHIMKWKNIIRNFTGTIIGICAGMQVLAIAHGLKLKRCLSIGMNKINLSNDRIKVYDLHQYSVEKDNKIEVLAKHQCIEMFRIRGLEHYGIAFHPEVLNKEMLEKKLRFTGQ